MNNFSPLFFKYYFDDVKHFLDGEGGGGQWAKLILNVQKFKKSSTDREHIICKHLLWLFTFPVIPVMCITNHAHTQLNATLWTFINDITQRGGGGVGLFW